MATVQITTWDEFKTAATETITENTTYEIMNDIDVSDLLLTSTLTIAPGNFKKIFRPSQNNEYVVINGITSYSSNYVFRINRNTEFYNIRFSNMMLQSAGLFQLDISTTSSMPISFNNCFFNGVVNNFHGTVNSHSSRSTNQFFENCSFNLSLGQGFLGSNYQTFRNCYFIIEKYYTDGNYAAAYFNNGNCINCYCGGKLVCASNTERVFAFNQMVTFINNVVNIDIDTTASTSTTIQILTSGSSSGTNTSLFNQSKITKKENQTISGIGIKQIADEQLKSKTYIQENTDFPLYG